MKRCVVLAIVIAALASGRGVAQLRPAPQIGLRSQAEVNAGDYITGAVNSVVGGDAPGALELANEAIRADPNGPWGYYVRGVAQLALKRVDDAVASFHDAERRFSASDPWGTSIAVWGQANSLLEARPCRDASAQYQRYASLVEHIDPAAAAMGRAFAKKQCMTPAPSPYAQTDPAWDSYRRGDQLLAARQFDEAVAAYREAEQRMPQANVWGRSIAIWGQANALKEAGRCREASPIYLRYAQVVQETDAAGAALGRTYAQKTCVPIRH